MYDKYKKNALKYYNPEGKLTEYRFKKEEALSLLDALEANSERLVAIATLKNPGEHEYGYPDCFFTTDSMPKDNITVFLRESYEQARDFIKKVIRVDSSSYFEITIEGRGLLPDANMDI
jgi:hypothetical protein